MVSRGTVSCNANFQRIYPSNVCLLIFAGDEPRSPKHQQVAPCSPCSNSAPFPLAYFGVIPRPSLVTHVLRETADKSGDPLTTDPMGQTLMSWDGFVMYEATLIYRTRSFREGPQKTELDQGLHRNPAGAVGSSSWGVFTSWLVHLWNWGACVRFSDGATLFLLWGFFRAGDRTQGLLCTWLGKLSAPSCILSPCPNERNYGVPLPCSSFFHQLEVLFSLSGLPAS